MKKLLVMLMLGAGFVTVASADTFDCTANPSNQCCIDLSSMENTIQQSPQHYIISTDRLAVYRVFIYLTNAGTDGSKCVDLLGYMDDYTAYFNWVPGNWAGTLHKN